MTRSNTRRGRGQQPALEGLEGRQLLSSTTHAIAATAAAVPGAQHGTPLGDRRMAYTTPQGSHVVITVYGVGSLAGTTVGPDGALNLVYGGTNEATGIVAKVTGGTGQATLRSIHPANVPIGNLSGIGGTVLNILNLKDFNLVAGGRINLTPGVHSLFLNSVGPNTQVNVRELGESLIPTTSSTTSSGTGTGTGTSGSTSANPGTSSATSNTTSGVTTQFSVDSLGARTLTGVSGTFAASPFLPNTRPPAGTAKAPGPPPPPPGALIQIEHIQGPVRGSASLGDAQIYGFDPVANALIRFDAVTGQPTLTVPLAGAGSPIAGVALGRNNGAQVALVGEGQTIRAFDAVTGAAVGGFSTANLAATGFRSIDGIGSTDDKTVLSDTPDGLLQAINVTASLASGQAVPVGAAYAPRREFELAGGLTGVAASNLVYGVGAAHFDTSSPDQTQAGLIAVDTGGGQLNEASRAALKNKGNFINVGPSGSTRTHPVQALGSIDQNLALVTPTVNTPNVVTLLNPTSLSNSGSVTLADPNRLAGLSESFRPGLAGAALIDVQGNLQSLRARDAQGLVLNVAGYVNLAKIDNATDTTIVALPLGHAQIPHRTGVTILSSSRTVDGRNGVTVVPNAQQAGPLSLT